VAPFPTLIGISKPGGSKNRGSNINDLDKESFEETSRSERLMFPTRQNIDRLLGAERIFESQLGREMSIEESAAALVILDG